MKRVHRGGWRVEREISVVGQSSVLSLVCAVLLCTVAPWGDIGGSVPHGALMKWLLTSCVHNALEAKCAKTEGERAGSGHDRSSTAKRARSQPLSF